MVVVFLDYVAQPHIELDNFFVRHTGEKLVVELWRGIEANDVRCFSCGEF